MNTDPRPGKYNRNVGTHGRNIAARSLRRTLLLRREKWLGEEHIYIGDRSERLRNSNGPARPN